MPVKILPISAGRPVRPADLLDCLPPGPGRILLESGPAGPPELRRWSFAMAEPFLLFTSQGNLVTVHEQAKSRYLEGSPFTWLQATLNRFRATAPAGAPPFIGGAVGYIGYDAGRQIERIPELTRDDVGLPEIWLGFYDGVLALEHETGQVYAIDAGVQRDGALHKLQRWVRRLKAGPAASPPPESERGTGATLTSTFTRPAYEAAVERVKAYIAAGDIYQANLAQRFSSPWRGDGRRLYDRLQAINPAPFAAYLDGGSWQVVSASPERFLLADGTGRIETRPIKGTRRRGATPPEDEALAQELLASEKDMAELVMIVDLERNDLGRVCAYGSVQVPDLRRLEGYPTVWHTVATVEGRLRQGVHTGQLLQATFPGGSITGAPKIRAMQIIEELEPVRRGVYTGSVGYIGFDGRLDLNIAIRTAVVRSGALHFHVGGGIVADSDPAAEYEETLAKGKAFLQALEVER